MTIGSSRDLIRSWHDIWDTSDPSAADAIADEILAPGFADHAYPGGPPGSPGVKQRAAAARSTFPGIQTTINIRIARGDKVAVHWTAHGTRWGAYKGTPLYRGLNAVRGLEIFRISDGRLAEHWEVTDTLGMVFHRLGVFPEMGKGSRAKAMLDAAFPDLQTRVVDRIAEEDRVATRWTAEGTHLGMLLSLPPTRKRAVVTGITICRHTTGGLVEERAYFDTLALLNQLGVVPMVGLTDAGEHDVLGFAQPGQLDVILYELLEGLARRQGRALRELLHEALAHERWSADTVREGDWVPVESDGEDGGLQQADR
jgi:predicted ester cyclase